MTLELAPTPVLPDGNVYGEGSLSLTLHATSREVEVAVWVYTPANADDPATNTTLRLMLDPQDVQEVAAWLRAARRVIGPDVD